MFKIRSVLLIVGSAVAGIYLTSEEGEQARKSLQKRKKIFEPIIKDMLKQSNQILDGSKDLNSTEIRSNIEKVVNEIKDYIKTIDLEKAISVSREAIKVASRKLNDVSNTYSKQSYAETKSKKTPNNKIVTKTKQQISAVHEVSFKDKGKD